MMNTIPIKRAQIPEKTLIPALSTGWTKGRFVFLSYNRNWDAKLLQRRIAFRGRPFADAETGKTA
jgi:hypothetical protein